MPATKRTKKKTSKPRSTSRNEKNDLAASIKKLEKIERTLRRRSSIVEPTWYKMPDLLCPKDYNFGEWDESTGSIRRVRMATTETDAEYEARQNRALQEFVTGSLFITKDGRDIPIIFTDRMGNFVSDVFFRRAQRAILWKSRGGGGSLAAAVLIWIAMVYHKMSFVDMAGALDQAKVVYDYVTQFWECIPGLKRHLVIGDPLISATKLKSGASLRCITSSEKQARGKHVPGLVLDESSIVPGTMIMTRDGVKPIEEIEVGEPVFCSDGRWNKVLEKINHQYSGRIVKLNGCGDGIGAWITEEHRVLGSTGVGVTRKGKDRVFASSETNIDLPDWHRAWDYDVGDVLVYPRPVALSVKLPDFLHTDDPKLWRFLGYWCGDGGAPETKIGNYPIKLHLSQAKEFFIDDAIQCASHVLGKIPRRYESPSRPNSIDLVISSHKEWWSILRDEVGLSHNRGLPFEWLEAASDSDLKEFVIGLMRTDGGPCFRPDKVLSKWKWTGTSSLLASNMMYCLSRLGIPAYTATRECDRYGKACKRSWCVEIKWHDAIRIMPREDFETKCIQVPTKLFSGKQWNDVSLWYSVIQSIEEDYFEGVVYDLRVENDTSFGGLQRLMLHNCQRDTGSDAAFTAAMNTTQSDDNHMIVMLSTFHVPVGIFQEHWDFAEEKGFRRYKWDVIDAMAKCDEGMEFANSDDPQALKFCRGSCPLTECVEEISDDGNVVGVVYRGCDGRARMSGGFMGRKNVISAKIMNTGSEVFNVEYLCERPQFSGPIYGLGSIERAIVAEVEDPDPDDVGQYTVGIDWGIVEGVLVLVKDCGDFVGVIESRYMSAKLTSEFAKILYEWEDQYGKFAIFADASHPFNNADLDEMGFDVTAVEFATLKEEGIANLLKIFVHSKIKILKDGNARLIEQLKQFHRDPKTGKPVKHNDHGPDSLMSFLDGKVPILTDKGWTPVSKIGVGTKVLTHKGRFREITRYEPSSYNRDHVLLNLEGRSHKVDSYRTTEEHPYLIKDKGWVEAREVKVGDEVAFLAAQCLECGKPIPYDRKSCKQCVGKVRNRRWKNPTKREDLYQFTYLKVVSVEVVAPKKPLIAYHFEVDEDKSYVARGIVSHNCATIPFDFMDKWPESLSIRLSDGSVREHKRYKESTDADIDEKGVDKHSNLLLF